MAAAAWPVWPCGTRRSVELKPHPVPSPAGPNRPRRRQVFPAASPGDLDVL
ncbi:hypothetical protein I545_1455 [Mycobacterium kansasii 662]|uniref:Uncharacterized protein n=2 Tax=Mycobacterium kansasii TaxID=1768 RepID=A0A1V3XSA4_MYCKA|nr:hypothetical protein I545_1455 [Mycobacterium kansasii 662]KEP42545.1 hypothetical protein MKSMC1_23470 [Mycobacterium kansasii]OOK65967.1 hypothetical protein BZL29_7522 [Mycobacterium kansasii]OOK82103.1 hypothetical protein BZL30_0012 [Mycobacterium kansasii]